MADTLVLFNGLQLTDAAPGQVGRYKHLRAGSWVASRLLMYVFPSFPRLWYATSRAQREADNSSFQFNWRAWVGALEAMPKEAGAWAILARYLVHRSGSVSYKDVSDLACAVIELAMRDAEVELNAHRSSPKRIAAFSLRRAPGGGSEEAIIMGKIRSATGYNPRVQKIEKCVYRALVYRDAVLVFRMSQGAPSGNIIHSIVRGGR